MADYHTTEIQFLVCLDSRNGIQQNGLFNSSIKFYFEDPITKKNDSLLLFCCCLSFTCPNSIYNINELNSLLSIGSTDYFIQYGNYTANDFMKTLINVIGSSYSITLNNITNIFTLNNTTNDFTINSSSTIFNVMGFIQGVTYTSTNKTLTFPFTCNFNGLQSINLQIANFNTNNIDSFSKSDSPIIQNIPVDNSLQQIIFNKTNSFKFKVVEETITYLQIDIRDDLDNFINLNNQHFNITLCFSELININRFSYRNDFDYILKTGYN